MPEPVVPFISVVSPVYGAANLIDLLVEQVSGAVKEITPYYEIILVDDGSPDNAWSVIEQQTLKNAQVKGLKLSRNYGQHHAITAGLDYSRGEWVVVLDCDLQDNPYEIPRLLQKALEGNKIVLASRIDKKHAALKIFLSKIFNSTLSYLTGTTFDSSIGNFGIYHRQVINAICQMRESVRYFPAMIQWVGFQKAVLEINHQPRQAGSSAYSLRKKFKLALPILLSYSDKPLRLTVQAGILIALTAFIFALFFFIRAQTGQYTVLGYASIIISIWFFSGLIIFFLGIIGLYLAKTFEGVKSRPIYLVEEKRNFDHSSS